MGDKNEVERLDELKIHEKDDEVNGEVEESENEVKMNGTVRRGSTNTVQLQKKLERRIEKAWNTKLVDQQPKKSALLPLGRVPVPNKMSSPASALVTWESDSENEFEYSPLASNENAEINQQLLGDRTANLPYEYEDDLDLIPPRPLLSKPCFCCQPILKSCSIQ